jgi:hypothetical protein
MSNHVGLDKRWERQRKLLPKLQLKYPSDSELQEISSLAKVDEPSIFCNHILSIILDAHLKDASLRRLSTPEVRKMLNGVMRKAQCLASALKNVDVGSKGSADYAGALLEYEIGKFQFRNGSVLIPDYVELLNVLHNAASSGAARLPKADRGPKGAGGNLAFNQFIESLLMAARQRGGDWTNYKSAEGLWVGSLLKTLDILKPYLPVGFFPSAGELGRSVEHIRKKLKDHITKNRLSPV